MTLVQMLERNSVQFPDKTAIVHADKKITYRALDDGVNKVANALTDLGLNKGDRVGLMLPRSPELVMSFLGVAKMLGIAAPINFELPPEIIREILSDISPGCLIVAEQFLDIVSKAMPEDMNTAVISVGGGTGSCWNEIMQGKSPLRPPFEADEEDVVYLNYTSGSNGCSNGAVTTHNNIYWNTLSSAEALRLTHDDVHLCMFAPFAHPHELFARPLYLCGTMVIVDNVYPKSLAKAISDNGVTCVNGLPPMYEMLLELLEHKTYDLSSIRVPESGGMHTRVELIEKFRQRIGVPIVPVWGSTETSGIAIANSPGEKMAPGSVGKPCPHYEVKVVGEDGRRVKPGAVGEMIFRGPAVVARYYNETRGGSFRDGWYYSGDLGKIDEKGNFYFVERKSGMMKVAGHKVYPLDVEMILMRHPDIKEAVVISAPDRRRGEVPKAIIVTNNGTGLTEKTVIEFCRDRMPPYKVPRIVEFRKSLPKTGSGKINKKQLHMENV